MLQGLHNMSKEELHEVAYLAGVELKALEAMSEDQLRSHALKWIGGAVGAPNHQPETVERSALEWVAKAWNLPIDPSLDTNELERSVRIKIATDAAEYLAPTWDVSCALVAAGPPETADEKLDMLERSASLVVPSRSARRQLRAAWVAQCERWSKHMPLEALDASLKTLKGQKARVQQAVTLALVLSLADGRLSLEEEKLFKHMADEMGMETNEAIDLINKVNHMFWGHQTQVGPKGKELSNPEIERLTAVKAAELTLGSSGTLEGLILQARDTVKEMAVVQEAKTPPKSGWQRLMGSLSGLGNYLSSRLRNDEQVNLVRIIYLSILRQHAQAAAHVAAAEEKAARETPVAHPTPLPAHAVGGAPKEEKPKRQVKLDGPEPEIKGWNA